MDFALNDEQQMLQTSARRFFADHHPLSRARRALPWSDASQRQLWREMAEMGFLTLLVPEDAGGLGLSLTEAAVVAEEAGRQLLNLPWAASAVLLPLWCQGVAVLPAPLQQVLQAVASGERALHCVAEGDRWWDHAGQCSDIALVRGWHGGNQAMQIALLDAGALPGGAMALDPTLRQAAAPALAAELPWQTLAIDPAAREHGAAAHRLVQAAELVGVAQAALELACAWARERVQFGKPIGSYQAIKHQLANVWMGVDDARLAVLYASAALQGGLADARFACAAAEHAAIEGALAATRGAIQVHGGMGFTWEHDAHLYLKRAQHLSARLGGASRVLSRVEALALA